MKQLSVTLLLCFFMNAGFSQAKQFTYGGEKRRYIIFLPSDYQKDTNRSFPVVFNFHGGGMTMTEQMLYSQMNKTAEKQQFIVVYPQGIKQDWNVGFEMSYQHGTDDVGFISALMDSLTKKYRIRQNEVYATGLSRGGFFCHRLAAELPERFAAIAPVGAPIPDSVVYFNRSKKPMGMMLIQGDADNVVSYAGKANAYYSAKATYDYWINQNHLEGIRENTQHIERFKADSTSVHVIKRSSKGITVSLVSIKGGGHTWPGSDPFNIGFPLGKTSREINGNELIWEFFKAHSKSF